MTPSDALKLFDEATAADDFVRNRQAHGEIVTYVRRLYELIQPLPKGTRAPKKGRKKIGRRKRKG